MNKIAVKNRLINLEAEVKLLKNTVSQQPDFDIDEANWKRLSPAMKKVRKELYKEYYG